MRYVRAALARIAGVFTGHTADDDLRDELQAHLDMETAENIRRGMNPDEARRQIYGVNRVSHEQALASLRGQTSLA